MKNKIYLICILYTLFFSEAVFACIRLLTPTEIFLNKLGNYAIIFGIFLILFLFAMAIKTRNIVQITWKEKGKIIKKKCHLIVSDKKSVIFEDKNYRYDCSPNEIIQIKRKNRYFNAGIIILILFVLVIWGNYVISSYDNMTDTATFDDCV